MVRHWMQRQPVWLWPNLLSLDAPLVAVVWMWMFAKTWRVEYFPPAIYLLLALVVWSVYVADRLLDARFRQMMDRDVPTRHRIHARLRKPLTVGMILAVISSMGLLAFLPVGLWMHGSFVLVLVALYFVMSFVQETELMTYFKNILAGLAFAYGTAVGVQFYRPASDLLWFLLSTEVLSFAVLCIFNITAIDFWEESRKSPDPEVKRGYEMLLTLLLIMLGAFALLLAVFADSYNKPFFVAVLVATGLLYLVNRERSRFSMDAQRVLADLAMLLPLPVFMFYMR
ncbi:MAG: hypothetical protein HKN82_18135 [Akkermansiaceae bacterium]|nr:hypothetical protein [Akkermansiaceae bacterium]